MAAISSVQQVSTVTLPSSGSKSQPTVSSAPAVTVKPNVQVQQNVQQKVQHDAQPKQEQQVTEKMVQQAIQEASLEFAGKNESIGFNYEKKLGQLFVQIKDTQSGEVLREFPSQDFIRHRVAMREMIGLLLDKQA